MVARLDPASRITEGQDARLWVDTRHLHVFDPASGRNLTLEGGAPGAPASSAPAAPAGTGAAPQESAAADVRSDQAPTTATEAARPASGEGESQ